MNLSRLHSPSKASESAMASSAGQGGRLLPSCFLEFPVPLIIGGDPQYGLTDPILTVVYPGDETTEVGSCYQLPENRLNRVLLAAEQGFNAYRKTPVHERQAILTRLTNALMAHRQELAELITWEAGKPIQLSLAEVDRAVHLCQGYANQLMWERSEVYFLEGREAWVRRFPIGPVLAITPFNFPLNLILHKLAPAIAAGNSITIKPASKTPLTALRLAQLAVEAGYTALSVVVCSSEIAEQLVQSPVFTKLSFTGSASVGWQLKSMAGRKAVTLELGGNAACIVEEFSLPMDQIASRVAQGSFSYSGQTCISVQRILVRRGLLEPFMTALVKATRNVVVGDPFEAETEVGPMITLKDVHRSRGILKEAIQQGANVVYGGNTYNAFTMNPTIVNRTTPEMAINTEECFAPLVTVTPYDRYDEALGLVNDSRYGLQVGIYTNDVEKARLAFETLEVGGINMNDIPTFRLDALPYGGVKDSGLGREGILTGLEEMTVLKTMTWKR